MKKIFYEQQLLDFLKELFSTHIEFRTQTEENQFYKTLTIYIFSSTKKDLFNKIKELMETLNTNQSENFVSIADMLIMQGRKEGREEGRR